MFTSKLPKSVKIGNRKFDIIKEHMDEEDGGEFNNDDSIIVISSELDRENRCRVLVHEILHAAWVESGLTLGPKRMNDYEERILRGLDQVLADVIKDNPKVIRYLQERDARHPR